MKRYIAILLITVMAIGAAACQKTPESPIVIGKDYETMIEQAMTSDESTAEKALKDAVQAPDNFLITTLIISKKPGNTGISRDIRTEFTTDLLLSD